MSELKELKTAEYQGLLEQGGVAVIDFWAPWCGYCIRMMPVVEEIAGELEGKATIVKVNADEEPDLARELQVEVLPTFVIIKDGKVVDRKIGFLPKGDLQGAIEAQF
ncbi:thioredoxin [Veillonella agrestimuris]|uniref:thioredoxin n=1 Tax=Veillonella agrestimuris TaxID=2941340 RepID=UPI00203F6C15|nr:thioredoxin [Veillonella agrestimuris]